MLSVQLTDIDPSDFFQTIIFSTK